MLPLWPRLPNGFRWRGSVGVLASEGGSVGGVVRGLGLAQPSVSKHLGVLREVGLVESRRDGRQILYRTKAAALRPVHDWAGTFERHWRAQLRRIKERAESTKRSPSAADE